MRFEQLLHLIETVESGSISETSKNLYISQQGLSDSLRRLEHEVGFAVLVRNRKGCHLTQSGQEFYKYAQKVAKDYQEMLDYLAVLRGETAADKELVTVFVNPLFANVLIYKLMQDKGLNKLKVIEASIKHTITRVSENRPNLGIFLLMDNEIEAFLSGMPEAIALVRLFDDEILACLAKNSPLSQQAAIDTSNSELFRVNFDTSYYEYFGLSEQNASLTSVHSNDLNLHMKLILENNAVSITTAKLFPQMYTHAEIIAKPLAKPVYATFYLVYNQALEGEAAAQVKAYRLRIEQLIRDFVGETAAR